MDIITFDQFKQVNIRIGKVLVCEKVPDADKLLRLEVDFGSNIGKRQILSGIAEWYKQEDLVGKKLPFVVNLEPKKLRGLESQGMLFAVEGPEKPVLLESVEDVPEGSQVV